MDKPPSNPLGDIRTLSRTLPNGTIVEVIEPPYDDRSERTVVRKGDTGFIVSTVPYWNTSSQDTEVFPFQGYEPGQRFGTSRVIMKSFRPVIGYGRRNYIEPRDYHSLIVTELAEKLGESKPSPAINSLLQYARDIIRESNS